MCDLLLPTGFRESNVITSQRCDNFLGFWGLAVKDLSLLLHQNMNFDQTALLSFIFYFY